MNAERGGQSHDVLQRYIPFSTLHASNVGAMDAGFRGQGLLAQAGSLAQSPQSPPKLPENVSVHLQQFRKVNPMSLQPMSSGLAFEKGALVRSTAERYKCYGVGHVVKVRGDQAKVEFNPSDFMAPPYRSENKILLFSEMERIDTPLERAARGQWDEPWRVRLKMQAARVLTGSKGGATA